MQFTEEKLKYDIAKKEEEDLLMAEALLEAIAKKEKDLKILKSILLLLLHLPMFITHLRIRW